MSSYAGDEVGAIVVDVGSHTTKAGFAGEENPKAVVPSVAGVVYEKEDKSKVSNYYLGLKEISFARPHMEIENIFDPESGEICNLDYMERLLNYIYDERLGVRTNEHPLLMTEVPTSSSQNREKLTSLIFETFNAPNFFLSKQPVLSCFANGKYTALVVDSGHNFTTVTPVLDGYALQRSVIKTNKIGGKALDDELRKLIVSKRNGKDILALHQFTKQRNTPLPSSKSAKIIESEIPGLTMSFNEYFKNRIVSDIKISLLRVAERNTQNNTSIPIVSYEMNDGIEIEIGNERESICELLFNEEYGIHKLSYESINKCDVDLRKELYSNIILTGGTTLIPNLPSRYEIELSRIAPSNAKVKPPLNTKQHSTTTSNPSGSNQTALAHLQERKYTSFIGGSILASLGGFQQMWISKSEFDETGAAQCLLRKCP
ncbi:hypothetical protein FDP41_004530 [Naegleria fowleri]|uniref:Actin n=1 Tax=Naegleria fowleri TaxID=5763 RepID=A0A6A5BQU5_NAEFO|nr:uncharacterized protein FDP41_004530 [Naegleria fowleri]KAF0976631.1 hypothetical protein FDP41_004530 [Naegleria fowleri]